MNNNIFRIPFRESGHVSKFLLSLPSRLTEESRFSDCNKGGDSKQDQQTWCLKRSHSFQEALSLSTSDIASINHIRPNGRISPQTEVISSVQVNVQDSLLHLAVDATKQQQSVDLLQQIYTEQDSSSSFLSEKGDEYVCRICHEGEDVGKLISPCSCCGSVGFLHLSCLEQWLGASKRTHCELCKYEFTLMRLPCPVTEFIRNPPSPRHRNNLICDLVCFVVLTPVTTGIMFACIKGVNYYAQLQDDGWKQQGMLALVLILIIIYLTWLIIVIQYYYSFCKKWQKQNEIVKIIFTSPTKTERTLHSPSTASCKLDHLSSPLIPASHGNTSSNRENQYYTLEPNMCQLRPILKHSAALQVRSWHSGLHEGGFDSGHCHCSEKTSPAEFQTFIHMRHETCV